MTKYIPAKETAKIIRKRLKEKFPETKISVRKDRETAIRISWTDGPSSQKLKAETKMFEGRGFDLCEDLTTYTSTLWEGEEVCFGQYIFYSRIITRPFAERILAYCQERFLNQAQFIELYGSDDDTSFNIRNRHDHFWLDDELGKIITASDSDREFNWQKEKQEQIEAERREDMAIASQKEADKIYLSSLKPPKEYQNCFGVENTDFKVLGATARFADFSYCYIDEEVVLGYYGEFYSIPQPHNRKLIWSLEVRILNEEKERTASWTMEDLLSRIDPITPKTVKKINPLRLRGKLPGHGGVEKMDLLVEDLKIPEEDLDPRCPQWSRVNCEIDEVNILSTDHYDRFVQNLLSSYGWLNGKGGGDSDADLPDIGFLNLNEKQRKIWHEYSYVLCVAVTAKNRETILVDPEGRDYAEYIIFPDTDDISKKKLEKVCQSSADKKREPVIYQQVINFPNFKQ